MNPLEKNHRKVVERFHELLPDTPALMVASLDYGWCLVVEPYPDDFRFCTAGQVQTELDALADVEEENRPDYILGWFQKTSNRRMIEVDVPGK